MTIERQPEDMAAVTADEELLSALSAGADVGAGAVESLLAGWVAELDAAVALAPPSAVPSDAETNVLPMRAPARLRRRAASVVAITVALAATTGIAAAASSDGPLAGLHRALFGTVHDSTADRADKILTSVAGAVDDANSAGGISSAERADLLRRLDAVDALLSGDPLAAAALRGRSVQLRAAVLALPPLAAPTPPVTGQNGSPVGGEPGDDNGGDQSAGSGSSDGSSSDGSSSDSGDSGSSDSTSDNGGSTSTDGSSGSGSSDGGSTSTSGSTDGGSTSTSGSTDGGSTSTSGSTDGGSTSSGSDSTSGGSADG